MPIRFSTEAANADILGEDADDPTAAAPRARTPYRSDDRFQRAPRQVRTETSAAEGKPGKDKDAGEP